MKKYKIIINDAPEKLEAEVNALLLAGWHLHGDLKITVKGKETHWVQAMMHPNVNP